jgi:hypothetical protein
MCRLPQQQPLLLLLLNRMNRMRRQPKQELLQHNRLNNARRLSQLLPPHRLRRYLCRQGSHPSH